MRNISFSATKEQFQLRRKDVTRRLGWENLKPGTHLMAVEKAQGLKKGEHVTKLGEIVVISCEREQLRCIEYSNYRDDHKNTPNIPRETDREGFPDLTPEEFVEMFIKINPKGKNRNHTTRKTLVTRIAFDYVEKAVK